MLACARSRVASTRGNRDLDHWSVPERAHVLVSNCGVMNKAAGGLGRGTGVAAAAKAKSGTHWRRIIALTLFAGLMLAALALANSGRAAIETPPPPSVWSDKADYAPGADPRLSTWRT